MTPARPARPAAARAAAFWMARAIASRPTGRTETIRKLVAKLTAERGQPPSDEDIASILAISARAVRRHRDMIGQ